MRIKNFFYGKMPGKIVSEENTAFIVAAVVGYNACNNKYITGSWSSLNDFLTSVGGYFSMMLNGNSLPFKDILYNFTINVTTPISMPIKSTVSISTVQYTDTFTLTPADGTGCNWDFNGQFGSLQISTKLNKSTTSKGDTYQINSNIASQGGLFQVTYYPNIKTGTNIEVTQPFSGLSYWCK